MRTADADSRTATALPSPPVYEAGPCQTSRCPWASAWSPARTSSRPAPTSRSACRRWASAPRAWPSRRRAASLTVRQPPSGARTATPAGDWSTTRRSSSSATSTRCSERTRSSAGRVTERSSTRRPVVGSRRPDRTDSTSRWTSSAPRNRYRTATCSPAAAAEWAASTRATSSGWTRSCRGRPSRSSGSRPRSCAERSLTHVQVPSAPCRPTVSRASRPTVASRSRSSSTSATATTASCSSARTTCASDRSGSVQRIPRRVQRRSPPRRRTRTRMTAFSP